MNISTRSPKFKPARPLQSSFWHDVNVGLHFVVIGAPRCGTTWLCTCLNQHPEIFVPDELNFFTLYHTKGANYYNNIYKYATEHVQGDYSNTYMLDMNLPEIFSKFFKDIKIIMICREPVERAFSHYLMEVNRNIINPQQKSFADALTNPVRFSYFDFGLYYKHIRRYLEFISFDNFYVVIYDDLRTKPKATIQEIFSFLGVAPYDISLPDKQNTWIDHRIRKHLFMLKVKQMGRIFLTPRMCSRLKHLYTKFTGVLKNYYAPSKPEVPKEAESILKKLYSPENRKLEVLLHKKLPWD